MAGKDFNKIWNSDFYDLRSYESGLCHTYNPPARSHTGVPDRLYFMLGQVQDKVKNYMLFNFEIFLHEKGQFWPREGMKNIGQSKPIRLDLDLQVEGTFTRKKILTLDKPDKKCTLEEGYSFTKCLQNYLEEKSECRIDWFSKNPVDTKCRKTSFIHYFKLLIWARKSPWKTLSTESGCVPKCEILQYTFAVKSAENVDWQRKWISSFFLEPDSPSYEESVEYLSYDLQDLVGDVGGYLGLFLGWSLMSILAQAPTWVKYALGKLRTGTRKRKKERLLNL